MISKEYLEECFQYDEVNGLLVWKKRPESHFASKLSADAFNCCLAGSVAGSIKNDGNNSYYRLSLDGKKQYVHRLIWIMNFDYEPDKIDHIDGNGLNNCISNLRDVTNQVNCKNKRLSKANSSGIHGVRWNKQCRKWHARIKVDYKYKHLGLFVDFFDACCARKSAEHKYEFSKRHGAKL